MAKESISLYIDDNSLRLMVTQGKQIKRWAESPLEQGLVDNNVVVNAEEVASRIKRLFEVENIKTRKINLGLSGLRCFSRPISFPQLPKDMLDEAVRREAQRVLPVPLEELYLSWQTIQARAGQSQVFMVGIPRKITDALFKVMQLAGLRVSFLEIKPLLLTRVVRETTAVIVDVQAAEYDIVVMTDGIPQPVRSMRFTSGTLPNDEKLATIKNELNRTIVFYNTNNPEKTLAPAVPIFISGDSGSESGLYQKLSAELGHPVLPLPSPLACPAGLDPSHYMANIGLTFQSTSAKERAAGTTLTINALPPVYQYKPVSLTNVLILPSAVIAAGLLIIMVLLNQNVSADITTINTRLKNANQQLLQKQIQQKALSTSVTELQKKVEGAKVSLDGINALLAIMEEQAEAIELDLTKAMSSLPRGVNMSSIHYISNVLTITGKSPDEKLVSSYIANLYSNGRFGDIVVTEMTRNDINEVDFTLVGTLKGQTIGASSMEVALGSLPIDVTLTNVNSDEGNITLSGLAPNPDKVFSYLRVLEASGKFTEITIAIMTRTEEGNIIFSVVLKTGE